jgi:hypothetical protein
VSDGTLCASCAPGVLVVEVDWRVESINRLSREHHFSRARRRRDEYVATSEALKWHAPPSLPVLVRFVRLAPTLVDDDNLAIAFKTPRDCVADWLGVSDGPRETRVRWEYGQEPLRERLPFRPTRRQPTHKFACRFRIEISEQKEAV